MLQRRGAAGKAFAIFAMVLTLRLVIERRTAPNGVVYYASPLLEQAGAAHAFSTRIGGISPPPFDSLNLGNPSGCELTDAGDRIEENYARLFAAIGRDGAERCRLHQVHGNATYDVSRGHHFESGRQGDAMTSDDPSRVIAVRVADCVPILLATRDGGVVGAIHAGWRGVIAGVVPAALRRLLHRAGGTADRLLAAVGPSISEAAFEVGPEVIKAFSGAFGESAPISVRANGKGHVDLRAAVRLQLLQSGMVAANIDQTDRCTAGHADEFFSHRRDRGLTGRMAAVISPRG